MELRKRLVCLVIATFVAGCTADATTNVSVLYAELDRAAVTPSARVDASGRVHVVYVKGNDLYYSSSGDTGSSFAPAVRVNRRANFAAAGLFRGPELAMGEDGTIHIVWYNRAWQQDLPRLDYGVMYSRAAAGQPFEPERNLSAGPADGYSIGVAGNYVTVLWHTDDQLWQAASSDGGSRFQSQALSAGLPCECCDTAIQVDRSGEVSIMYRDRTENRRDMFRVNLVAERTGAQKVRLDDDSWIIEACPVSGADFTRRSGRDVAAWEHRGRILLATIERDHASASLPIDLGQGKFPVLALTEHQLLVAFKSGRTLKWTLRDAATLRQIDSGSVAAQRPDRPAVAPLADGRFLLFR